MTARALLLGLVLPFASLAPAQQERPAAVLRLPAAPVGFGAEFVFTAEVDRAFDDAALRPLVVERTATEAIAGGRERRSYRARCYALDEVTLAVEPAATLRVRTSLPSPAGEPEWPGDGWDLPRRGAAVWPWVALLLALGGAGFVWSRTRPRPAAGDAPAEAARAAVPVAVRLEALVLPDPADAAGVSAFHQQAKELVREHLWRRFALAATVRTSEELLRALPEAPRTLAACLAACDAVLFAAAAPGRDGSAAMRQAAVEFVRATEGGR